MAGPRIRRVVQAIALPGEPETYLEKASIARERAAYFNSLEPLAGKLGDSASRSFERTVNSHERYASAMERRATLYGMRRPHILARAVTHHILQGDYTSRSTGGLGLASLAKDLAIAVSRR